jgi:hypothetical protein
MHQPSKRGILLVALTIAATACSPGNGPIDDARVVSFDASDAGNVTVTTLTRDGSSLESPSGIDPPDTGAELEQLLIAYAQCVEESFPIAIRFKTDPFFGMSIDVASRFENEGDLVDSVVESCKSDLALDERTLSYQTANPVTPEEEKEAVTEFAACIAGISDWASEAISEATLDTIGSLSAIQDEMYLAVTTDAQLQDLFDVGECYQATLFGAVRVFAEGHDWYVPQS